MFPICVFSQDTETNYTLYSKILSERLELGKEVKDSVVIVDQFVNFFNIDDFSVFSSKSKAVSEIDLQTLYIQTYKDTIFLKRLYKETELQKIISDFAANIKQDLKILPEKLQNPNLIVYPITAKKFNLFFGKRRTPKSWEKLSRKYGSNKFIEFSKITYSENFAVIYYADRCGGLCGSGNIVVFEKVNGLWKILTEINLVMS